MWVSPFLVLHRCLSMLRSDRILPASEGREAPWRDMAARVTREDAEQQARRLGADLGRRTRRLDLRAGWRRRR